MKRIATALVFALTLGTAFAQAPPGCPTVSPNNLFIVWASERGDCTNAAGHCAAGETLTFSFATFGASLACSTYTVRWDFGDGSAPSTSQTSAHRFSQPGVYKVSLLFTNAFQQFTVNATVDVAAPRQRVAPKTTIAPLDEQTLRYVTLGFGSIGASPGDTRQLRLMLPQCCVYSVPVNADVRFSIDPTDYATITTEGSLRISPTAPGGFSFRVYANIENGRRIVSNGVYVDTPESNPLRQEWRQVAEISCSGSELPATAPGLSLLFRSGNQFDAVWYAFEVYKDYWGLYTFDTTAKTITMGILGANYRPPNFKGEGSYDLTTEGGKPTLRLKNIWLGRPRGDTRPPGCGMVFQ